MRQQSIQHLAAALFVHLSLLGAQTTVYLRSGEPAGVRLTNCTNATPVVCTTNAPHHLSAGHIVVISNVVGNTAVNGARKIRAVLSATQFSLNNLAGTPLAGNGAWSPGGTTQGAASPKNVGRALPYQLSPHPRLLLDGINGTYSRRLRCSVSDACLTSIVVTGGTAVATVPGGHGLSVGSSFGVWNSSASGLNGTHTVTAATATTYSFTTAQSDGTYNNSLLAVSEYGFAGNPAWDSMVLLVNGFADAYQKMNANPSMERYMNAAFVWFTDRENATAFSMAKWAVNHAEDSFYGTAACNQALSFCGGRTGTDYIRFNSFAVASIYSLLVSANQLDSTERSLFAAKMLNDVDTGCTLPPFQTGAGTVSSTYGQTTITGTGTAFTTDFAPGDSIFLPVFGNDDNVVRIESVESDTSMTASQPVGSTHNGTYQHVRAWQATDCGALFLTKNHAGSVVGDPANYPTRGSSEPSYFHNLALTSLWSYVHLGLALAEDPRGEALLEAAWLYGYDNQLGYTISSWTGLTSAGSGYHWYRSPWMAADLAFTAKYVFQGFPDLVGPSPYWLKGVLPLTYYSFMPFANSNAGTAFGPLFGEGSLTVGPYWLSYQSRLARLFENEPEGQAWRSWLRNRFGYTSSSISEYFRQGSVNYYLGVNPNLPDLDHTTLPRQYLFNRNGFQTCAGLGMAQCFEPDRKYALAVSRTGWTSTDDSEVQIYGGTYEPDHFENQAGDYRIVRGVAGNTTPCLVGGDSTQCTPAFGGLQQNNLLEVGETYARRGGQGDYPIADITRWAGPRPAGDPASRYFYAMVDLTGVFKTSANVSRARRHFAHFKLTGSSEELLVIYDDVGLGAPASIRSYAHYSQNGEANEGVTTCPGSAACSTIRIDSGRVLSQSSLSTVVTQFLSPHPSTRFRLFVNNANGSYTGGNNHSFRVTYCATHDDVTCAAAANGLEAILVHRIVPGTSDTTLTATLLSPSAAWTGVQTASTVSLFARQGGQPTHVPAFTTTHGGTAQYLIAGLAPGTYDVKLVDNSTVVSAVAVTAGDNSIYFSGTAGTYMIVPSTLVAGGASADAANLAALASYLPGSPLACNWQLASDEGMTAIVASGTDEAGSPWRQAPLGGLTPASVRYFRAQCDSVSRYAVVQTPGGSQTGTRSVVFSVRPLPALAADNVLLQWGTSAEALTSSSSTTCTNGCSPSITAAANSVLFARLTYRTGATVKGATQVRRVLVH